MASSNDTNENELKIDFKFPDFDLPVFKTLRNEAGLKDLPADEFEKALQICGLAHGLFAHDGDNMPSSFDALTILRGGQAGQSFRCVEYSILAQGLLLAYKIPARVVGLKTADVETRKYGAGHVVVEFWNSEKAKWIMCDVQWGIVPKVNNNFLNAVELGRALEDGQKVDYEKVPGSRFDETKTDYSKWVHEYLYFYDTDIRVFHQAPYVNLKDEQKLMLVPSGVKPPKIFQKSFEMNLIYTNRLQDFYPVLS